MVGFCFLRILIILLTELLETEKTEKRKTKKLGLNSSPSSDIILILMCTWHAIFAGGIV